MTITAGKDYEAGEFKSKLLGSDYRSVWTTPIKVPVLDLSTFAGGLTVVERGGGEQTQSLRFLGEDGFEYNFRSVDKEITQGLSDDLAETVVDDIVQDQVSSMHPASAIVATALLDAVGILNPGPQLFVMPDDPRLGEYRELFGGMLGMLEAHANESEDGSRVFAGADEVESEEDFFAELREDPQNRADPRAYLASRLMSMLMGDWDRHEGQFRWARFDSAGIRRWVPVPEDRDFAFSDYDGFLLGFAGSLLSEAAPFTTEYRLRRLTQNSAEIDRRILTDLEWPAWDSVFQNLQSQLPDDVIEAAVRTMPAPYFEESGPELIRILSERRDHLGDIARLFYLQLAADAEIHTTDEPQNAEIVRLPNGDVRVEITSEEGAGGADPYFLRVFHPAETDEIRLRLYDGDDTAVVRGSGPPGILIRVVGGEGDDVLVDSSSVAGLGIHTAFYDEAGDNEIVTTTSTAFDATPYLAPVWIPEEQMPPRDWGTIHTMFLPWAGYEGTEGLIIGGGPQLTWYGFRRTPFSAQVTLRGMYGLESGEFGIDGLAEFVQVGSRSTFSLHGRASGLEAFRFHGFGNFNDTDVGGVFHYDQMLVEALFGFPIASELKVAVGPAFEHIDIAEFGGDYGKVGLRGILDIDTRPDDEILGGGFRLEMDGGFYPEVWDLERPFGRVTAELASYSPLPGAAQLALRAGGAQILGTAPIPDAVFLGGSETVRGITYQRYAGDATLFGGAELRAKVARAELLVRGDLGLLAFSDAGRVFVDGDSPGGWHTSYGGGIWFASLQQVVSLTYAQGEDDGVFYLSLGFPF
ncbi:MAG TPA: hypothetical protein VFI91_13510 [Longimicrobiaceae bacterium]|nr:hypothetical protein [Longimicrobiaceae bacterium]